MPNNNIPQEDAPYQPNNAPNVQENNPNMDMPNADTPLFDGAEDRPGLDLPDNDVPQSDWPPITGETILTILWIGLLIASGIGLLVAIKGKKRNRN